jgi:glycosyltransferase involved in cell wall biosynthesis
MLTYNHESFVAEAIKGIIMQEVDADLELIIGDDCSTDHTISIIKRFVKDAPFPVRLIERKYNVGMMYNFVEVLKECKGDYIAICEGDDYWICPSKLKMQFQAMELEQSAILCFTDLNVSSIAIENNLQPYYLNKPAKIVTLRELLNGNCIVTCTVMFRNVITDALLQKLVRFTVGDWPLYILLLNNKNSIGIFLDQITSDYRKHTSGSYSTLNVIKKLKIDCTIFEELYKLQDFTFEKRQLKYQLSKLYYGIGLREVSAKRKQYLKKSFSHIGKGNSVYPIKSLARLFF